MKEYIFTGRVDCEDQQMSTPGCIVACCNLKSYAKKTAIGLFSHLGSAQHTQTTYTAYMYRLR